MKASEIVGMKFGRWSVLGISEKRFSRSLMVMCQCECGTVRSVRPPALRDGSSLSCGCFRIEMTKEKNSKHGLSRTPTYVTWRAMLGRCYDPNNASFKSYSTKGITVCDEWKEDFERFLSDMGERPSKNYTLDRIDGSRGYSKDNCRWATKVEQQANRMNSVTICVAGETKTASEWARVTGIGYQTIIARKNMGWAADEIVFRPVQKKNLTGAKDAA